MIVPVGLLGLATMRPAGGSGSASSMATVGWIARLRPAVEFDDAAAEGLQRVAVCRVAGPAHRHRVAGVEGGEEERGEAARRAGRDDDLVGVDVSP
jgi:hypothetical protein